MREEIVEQRRKKNVCPSEFLTKAIRITLRLASLHAVNYKDRNKCVCAQNIVVEFI